LAAALDGAGGVTAAAYDNPAFWPPCYVVQVWRDRPRVEWIADDLPSRERTADIHSRPGGGFSLAGRDADGVDALAVMLRAGVDMAAARAAGTGR
jgi:hypothetical protein